MLIDTPEMKMKHRSFVLLIILIGFSACGNRYGFDFNSDWAWDLLKKHSTDKKVIEQINNIENSLSIQDAHFLFLQISSLKNPLDIKHLSQIESDQNKSGGGYYGFLPKYFQNPDPIPVPDNFNNIIACADYLTEIKNHIDKITTRPNFQYNRTFLKRDLSAANTDKIIPGIQIDVNTDAVMDVLKHYIDQDMTMELALNIANHTSFQVMLKNRKEIGYIPEPLPKTDDLAMFIYSAGNSDPLSKIWKWLNPWNCFGFADLYLNASKYYEICLEINKNKEQFAANILARFVKYLPEDFEYRDKIDLGVNWGVLTWGTDTQVGLNIVQFKNDYSSIYRYTSGQLFRKMQTQILRKEYGVKSDENIQINDIVGRRFGNIYDKIFYEVFTQILLDGTTAYVSGKDKSWIIVDGNKYGKDLLNQIYFSLYEDVNIKTVEYCESEGFGTNGPLVSIGYRITQELVKKYGNDIIYEILKDSYFDFYLKYFEIEKEFSKRQIKLFDSKIIEKIIYLNSLK